jgi:hypothetical protein
MAAINTGCSRESRLVIIDAGSGKVYGKWPVSDTDIFSIEFIHSVNQSPVRESFRVERKMIHLQQVRFFSFGAGMPDELEEGLQMSRDGDAIIVSGYNTSFEELNYIVGTVSDHVLGIGNEEISLRDLCGRNAHVTISVR